VTNSLLTTKLEIPAPQTEILPRPSLFERLNEGLERKLTLVSAPAGYGKTTLLSEWARSVDWPVAWFSLDPADNDFDRFMHYFIAALQKVEPHIGELATVMLEGQPPRPAEVILTALINDLAQAGRPLSIVLDNYQVIDVEEIHLGLGFLLDHMPAAFHLVIATRADPPLHLARLRAGRQIVEIREEDLQFGEEEIAAFLNRAMGLKLAPADIALLQKRTEGWIASLQMVAISMQGRQDLSNFIHDFSGSHEYVVDYLTDEVLSRQPGELEAFLLQTSILDKMCGPLCDAVTGQSGGQETLEELRRNNLFVVPLDTEREWYRYHRLFADLLQQRLRASGADMAGLFLLASEWHEANDLLLEAIDYAMKAEAFDRAAGLIERIFDVVTAWSRVHAWTLSRWLDALPAATVQARPSLRLIKARLFMVKGELPEASATLVELEAEVNASLQAAGVSTEDTGHLLKQIRADLTSIAVLEGRLGQAIEYAHQALAELPKGDTGGHMRQSAILGTAHFRMGNLAKAQGWYAQAVADAGSLGIPVVAASLITGQAQCQAAQGQLRLAEASCEEALRLATIGGQRTSAAGPASLAWAKILYERNDLEEAESKLRDAIELLKKSGPVHTLAGAYAWLARTRQVMGDGEGAGTAMNMALRLVQGHAYGYLSSAIPAHQARLFLAQGQLHLAIAWARDYQQLEPSEFARDFEELTLARVLLAKPEIAAARGLLSNLQTAAEARARRSSLLEILLLNSLAYRLEGNEAAALKSLEEALTHAEPEGYVRTFVDEGEPLADLLSATAKKGVGPGRSIAADYAVLLLKALGRSPVAAAGPTLLEPLSEREMQVLRLLETDLTVPEIAEQLVIGTSTVRSHVKSVYGKLGVHSRYEAVVRAEELKLL
jgi:LuxR family maltose regulon positive regulatory protein